MFSSPTLTIDLSALATNWRTLRECFTGEETAAVVKADAYGLGAIPVTRALERAGCHSFFVATLEEGITLRAAFPDIRILVLHGVGPGEEFAFRTHRLIPVLNSPEQLARWRPVAAEFRDAQSALMLDTGMERIGFTEKEWDILTPETFESARVSLILSHLTSASEPDSPENAHQLALFNHLTARTHGIPLSLSNSGGILLPAEYHFHLARPGCALYGIHPSGLQPGMDTGAQRQEQSDHEVRGVKRKRGAAERPPVHATREPHISLLPVAFWDAPIIQVHTVDKAGPVGYGASQHVAAGTRIATVASGYADGYHRRLSNNSYGVLAGHRVPLLGRVTMDMLSFDVTNIPEAHLYESARITLLGADPSVDALADRAGTIGYEILTSIGLRVKRTYIGEAA